MTASTAPVTTGIAIVAAETETADDVRVGRIACSSWMSESVTRARDSNPAGPPVAPLPPAWPKMV